jgi:hypothetical protein
MDQVQGNLPRVATAATSGLLARAVDVTGLAWRHLLHFSVRLHSYAQTLAVFLHSYIHISYTREDLVQDIPTKIPVHNLEMAIANSGLPTRWTQSR